MDPATSSQGQSPLGLSGQPTEQTSFGLTPNVAAALCYFPLQGIFILISIIMLCSSKNRIVRFAAKQSLLQFACGLLVAILAAGIGLGLVIAVPEGSPAHTPAIILLAAILGAVFIWHLGAYIVACVQAFRDRIWVMPWLRWLIGKSAPSLNLEASKTQ